MKKLLSISSCIFLLSAAPLLWCQEEDKSYFSNDDLSGGIDSQTDDELFGGSSSYTDDELFGGSSSSTDDDLFGSSDNSDDFFMDDGIEEWTPADNSTDSKAKGILFDSGSIKIGGKLTSTLGTSTVLRTSDETDESTIWDYISETTLTPSLTTQLSVDARPTQTLRMYVKTEMGLDASYSSSSSTSYTSLLSGSTSSGLSYEMTAPEIKEMFTDFSIADRAFFRFGLHTVSWGTGYFFSPVSDIINTSSINPEDVTEQISGCVNLRTQITFPGTQNCLWIYLVPPLTASGVSSSLTADDLQTLNDNWDNIDFTTDFPGTDATNTDYADWLREIADQLETSGEETSDEAGTIADNTETDGSLTSIYLKHLALAAKGEIVLGGWELGFGGFYKFESAPKLMTTFSGSVYHGKIGVFGEGLYQYGSDTEWNDDKTWKDKSSIIQFTAGCMRMISDENLTIAAQYYYDGNDSDLIHKYFTKGHNLAAVVSKTSLFGNSDLSATFFGMINFGKSDLKEDYPNIFESDAYKNLGLDITSYLSKATIYANLTYSPADSITFNLGPYISIPDFDSSPNVSLRFTASLGGGKF